MATEGSLVGNDRQMRHEGRRIEDEIRIDAPAETIWQAWTDPSKVPAWFVDRAEGRMEVGETVRWFWDRTDGGMTHRVLAADPPQRLLLALDVPQGATLIEITIEQVLGHSVLRLVQSGFGHGAEWDEQYDGMASGWMIALAILKHFAERYFDRKRTEVMVLSEVQFELEALQVLQRTDEGLARWLSRSGQVGTAVGDPVRLVLADGRTLTGTLLRQTPFETLWSWDEIDGVMELKAFRGPHWGSKVGIRLMSWLEDAGDLMDLEGMLGEVVGKLASLLA
jgi:uncharacterized protein YndB with AHSA1/START domain